MGCGLIGAQDRSPHPPWEGALLGFILGHLPTVDILSLIHYGKAWMWLLTTYAKANYSEYTVQQTVNSQDIQKRYTSKKSSEMVWAGGMKRKLNSKKKYKSSQDDTLQGNITTVYINLQH